MKNRGDFVPWWAAASTKQEDVAAETDEERALRRLKELIDETMALVALSKGVN